MARAEKVKRDTVAGVLRQLKEASASYARDAATAASKVWELALARVAAIRASTEPAAVASAPSEPAALDARGACTLAWKAMVDALPAAAVALDSAGNVSHYNAAAIDIYPRLRFDQPISHVSRNPEFMGAVERIAQSPEPISVEIVERVPVERRFFATLVRISSPAGIEGLPFTLITFRDTSEQDKLVQMRADFIANASHELRTPLASLRGFVETLQGPARDDPVARERFLGMMATQASRMTRLIDDLLSLSRAEMRVHLPPQGIVELNEVCAFVVQTMEILAESANVTVTLERLPGPAVIRGEREEIVQVLQNLVQNSIKYGREGGHVAIALTREVRHDGGRDRVAVAIADDGPGIAPEHLPRLTERFYRANVSSSREKGGTGLGLAIVKHIVNRHRGDLKIQSVVGAGSTFTILFDALTADRSGSTATIAKFTSISTHNAVIK